ncbi:MAG: tetraacyldisaccharide 4'-kinase, partial [Bacteroidales bacterium]|nr:tetraacyldisaccharide 4'-kinase [Bacteroidales bacterium]
MDLPRILLFPLALGFGLVIRIRNLLFNMGILRSVDHGIPVISVGNLAAGGTGKTPHVEYLVRLLSDRYKVATLSRGYGRDTKGYRLAGKGDSHSAIGDEPM